MINKPVSSLTLEIEQIKLGYYAKGLGEEQDYYKPVWIFYCKDRMNNTVVLSVDAAKI